MGLMERLLGRSAAAPPGASPQEAPRPSARARAPDLDVIHAALPPVQLVDGHWWSATPRMIVRGPTFVAGASVRGAAVSEAHSRYGPVILAQLAADPSNPHDLGAVAVWAADLHVGYVQREVLADNGARTLRRMLEQDTPVTVWASIEPFQHRGGDYLGVTLHHELRVGASKAWPFPVAFPPLAHAKVSGDDEALSERLEKMRTSATTDRSRPDRTELSLAATLALIARPDGTTGVDVNVKNNRVGVLSAAEAGKRIAVVQSVVEAGREPVAQLRLSVRRGLRPAHGLAALPRGMTRRSNQAGTAVSASLA